MSRLDSQRTTCGTFFIFLKLVGINNLSLPSGNQTFLTIDRQRSILIHLHVVSITRRDQAFGTIREFWTRKFSHLYMRRLWVDRLPSCASPECHWSSLATTHRSVIKKIKLYGDQWEFSANSTVFPQSTPYNFHNVIIYTTHSMNFQQQKTFHKAPHGISAA